MIEAIHQRLEADGFDVSISKRCARFGIPRRSIYYRTQKAPPKVQPRFAGPIHALIARFGTLGRAPRSFLLRSDNGLVFTRRHDTARVRSYGLQQEFITSHCPRQRFETLQHADLL